ncbi:DUF2771 domain-containing protein [Streptomyces sp. NPDC088725]|uniref:DUF2771 domain-containing protein n=1 Tax=Streptomyces sp. NPDC088725 TaxID=3365873 RepID=UPI003811C6DC
MTVAFFPGRARRAGVVLGAVSAGLLVLSACDKPTPLATVTVGSDSVNTEAACYNDGKPLKDSDAQPCLNKKATKTIKSASDDTVRIGVDPELADHGWAIFLDGRPIDPDLTKSTYRSEDGGLFFAPNQTTGQPAPAKQQLSILQVDGQKLAGVWNFTLEKKDS